MRILLIVLVAIALFFRIFIMAEVLRNPQRAIYESDSMVHDRLAANILAGNGFTLYGSPSARRSITRVPLYPAFLAAVRAISASEYIRTTVVLQNALAVFSAVILFVFIRRRYGVETAGVALFVMLACIPAIACSNFLFTEIPYVFLSISGVILFVVCIERSKSSWAIAAGAVAAAATLCRPIHVYFPWLLAGAGLASTWKEKRRKWSVVAVFAGVYVLGILPWMARNYATYGTFELTRLNELNLYLYKAGGTIAMAEGRDFDEVLQDLIETAEKEFGIRNIYENPRSGEMVRYATRTIASHPGAFVLSSVAGCTGIALMPDKVKISWIMGREAPQFRLLWREGGRGGSVLETLKSMNFLDIALMAFQAALLLFVYGTIIYGLMKKEYRFTDLLILISFLAIAYYFVLPAGAESEPRFRIPAMPYLGVLAGYCLRRKGC